MSDDEKSNESVIMFKELLEMGLVGVNQDVQKELSERFNNEIYDGKTDMLLRKVANVSPYNMIIPSVRWELDLMITTDEQCSIILNSFKNWTTDPDEIDIINKLVDFVNSEEGELDSDICPELDLRAMSIDMPIDIQWQVLNCIDYIKYLTE
jgi:hypothetical protein